MLDTKATELDRTIRRLTAMHDGLCHAAACPATWNAQLRTLLADAVVAPKRRKST